MKKDILFIQGGGEGGYEADEKLAASLKQAVGDSYNVYYPQMQVDEAVQDFGWPKQIDKEISKIKSEVILVGHSLGASMSLKFLSENEVKNKISGIFLISTPFWDGDEDWIRGLKLKEDFSDKLPKSIPVFLYHCRDDKEIPYSHLSIYRQRLPNAVVREIDIGGHQLDNDLSIVADDIKTLWNLKLK